MSVEDVRLHHETQARLAPIANRRVRSDGVLSAAEVERCRAEGVALAYDPIQIGWVMAATENDLSTEPAETELVFRHWENGDAATLAAMLSSERLWKFLPETYAGPVSKEAAAQLIDVSRADHHLVLAVTRDDVPIGQVRLLFNGPEAAEISYWFGEAYWGNGYASEVVRRFTQQSLRDRPDLTRLFAVVHKNNPASRRVLEKAGFAFASRDGDWLTLDCVRDR